MLTTRKDMSFLSGFITAGFFVLLGAVVASFFFQISGLQLAISAGFVLFSSACILFQTSAIIHGGERNYIMATISLYVSIYNLFVSLLQLVGLAHRGSHRPNELSGGQQQRVAIARAIVSDPTFLICDEPTGDLDRHSAEDILNLLKMLNREHGKTIIMVTHDPKAAEYATHTIHLDKGELVDAPAAAH